MKFILLFFIQLSISCYIFGQNSKFKIGENASRKSYQLNKILNDSLYVHHLTPTSDNVKAYTYADEPFVLTKNDTILVTKILDANWHNTNQTWVEFYFKGYEGDCYVPLNRMTDVTKKIYKEYNQNQADEHKHAIIIGCIIWGTIISIILALRFTRSLREKYLKRFYSVGISMVGFGFVCFIPPLFLLLGFAGVLAIGVGYILIILSPTSFIKKLLWTLIPVGLCLAYFYFFADGF